MRLEYQQSVDPMKGEIPVLVLSHRNLLAGLHKLEMEDSARTLWNNDFILKFETDEEHYSHPSRRGVKAGAMHPDTEKFILRKELDGSS